MAKVSSGSLLFNEAMAEIGCPVRAQSGDMARGATQEFYDWAANRISDDATALAAANRRIAELESQPAQEIHNHTHYHYAAPAPFVLGQGAPLKPACDPAVPHMTTVCGTASPAHGRGPVRW